MENNEKKHYGDSSNHHKDNKDSVLAEFFMCGIVFAIIVIDLLAVVCSV